MRCGLFIWCARGRATTTDECTRRRQHAAASIPHLLLGGPGRFGLSLALCADCSSMEAGRARINAASTLPAGRCRAHSASSRRSRLLILSLNPAASLARPIPAFPCLPLTPHAVLRVAVAVWLVILGCSTLPRAQSLILSTPPPSCPGLLRPVLERGAALTLIQHQRAICSFTTLLVLQGSRPAASAQEPDSDRLALFSLGHRPSHPPFVLHVASVHLKRHHHHHQDASPQS